MIKKPILAVTMGDPASVGPEISVKSFDNPKLYEECKPFIVGDAAVMKLGVELTGRQGKIKINAIHNISEALFTYGTIDVMDMGIIDVNTLQWGKIKPEYGHASFVYVTKAIQLAMDKQVDATVTNALCKESINLAGHHYSGHTEIYAEYTETNKYAMMLASEDLRVVHVSTHVSLREACDRVKKQRVLDCIKLANDACKKIGIKNPIVAVAGLNPHAGENGLFGSEEIEEIIPAIEEARRFSINVEGPLPPDTIFSKVRGGWYDIAVVMYHDQGHIPLKILGFIYNKDQKKWDAVEGVNITLGLPIVRTSVDHGTAFDQAGKGTGNELSLNNAINYAIKLSGNSL